VPFQAPQIHLPLPEEVEQLPEEVEEAQQQQSLGQIPQYLPVYPVLPEEAEEVV
jgi:hypothetical protein